MVVPLILIDLAVTPPLVPLPNITALPVVAVAVMLIAPLLAVSGPLYQQHPTIAFVRTQPLVPVATKLMSPVVAIIGLCITKVELPPWFTALIVTEVPAVMALSIKTP